MSKIIYANEIAAIVVTYNRLELLKKVIDGLLNQTLALNKIIVVNNNSTDGTAEWLDAIAKKHSHITIILQENSGSSGGQFTGTKTAFEMGYEWIWVMDDDVVPTAECLENLMFHSTPETVCQPLRIGIDGKMPDTDLRNLNITNPFQKMFIPNPFTAEELQADFIPIDIVPFEGPIFHHSMFEKVGFPDKNFFIHGDDTEFSIRLRKCGVRFLLINKAILNRMLHFSRKMDFDDWKFYYLIRNLTAIDVLHGNIFVRVIRPFLRVIPKIFKCKKISQLKTLFRALSDGYFYK